MSLARVSLYSQLFASAEVDANVLWANDGVLAPARLAHERRWRRGGVLAVLVGVVRLFFLAAMLMFGVMALLVRLEGRTHRC